MNKQSGRIGLYLVLIVALIAGYLYLNNQAAVQSDYTYGQLEQAVTDGKVTSATIHQNSEVPTGSVIVNISGEGQKRIYVADVNEAEQLLRESGLDPAVEDVPKQSVFMNSVFPVLLTCGLIIFLMLMMNRQMSGGGGGTNAKMMNFGKSRARMSSPDDNKKVTFDKVAGLQEEKEDLVEVVDFLKSPQKYTKVGARIPKGVLLVGPPGTGKTLLAKAVAGEANVPFFSLAGSDFVEMFVGVGASRVRDMFEEAKKNAPCIIFIDEIDAVGAERGSQRSNRENDQTINAMLTELDGFDARGDILVIAATNRADTLDPALLRSGRFDRQIRIDIPKKWETRKELFQLYLKGNPIEESSIDTLAKQTVGFSGADIAAVCREAKMIAFREDSETITPDFLEEAIDKKVFKGNRSDDKQHEDDLAIVAYHEAGHAVMTLLCGKEVSRISIMTSGVGGAVFQSDSDRFFETKHEYESHVMIAYAGRASEQIHFGSDNITQGACNDIAQATKTLIAYVAKFGFDSEYGLVDMEAFQSTSYGDDVRKRVSELSNKFYEKALHLLSENYNAVEVLAQHLLEVKTMSGDEAKELIDHVTKNQA